MATEEVIYYHSRADLVETADGQSTVEEELKLRSKTGHTHPATDIIEDATHRFTSDEEKAKFEAQGVYTNTNKVPVNIGGIEAGSTFANASIQSVLTNLLYPYTAPSKKIAIIPDGGVYELGSAVDISKVSVEVEPKTNPITKIEIALGNTIITSENVGATTENISKAYSYEEGEARATSNSVVTATITEQGGQTSVITSSEFKFVYPIYAGAVSVEAPINESLVKGVNKYIENRASKTSKTFDCNNERILFAYPASFGSLSRIDDENGFNILPTFTKYNVIITCLDGSNVSYNVYVNEASTISNFNITFYFV